MQDVIGRIFHFSCLFFLICVLSRIVVSLCLCNLPSLRCPFVSSVLFCRPSFVFVFVLFFLPFLPLAPPYRSDYIEIAYNHTKDVLRFRIQFGYFRRSLTSYSPSLAFKQLMLAYGVFRFFAFGHFFKPFLCWPSISRFLLHINCYVLFLSTGISFFQVTKYLDQIWS